MTDRSRMNRLDQSAIVLTVLAGCTAAPSPDVGAAPPYPVCNAIGLQPLVGRSRDILAAMTFPAPMRIIDPGDLVTQDYNPDRLNVVIGPNRQIVRVFCG